MNCTSASFQQQPGVAWCRVFLKVKCLNSCYQLETAHWNRGGEYTISVIARRHFWVSVFFSGWVWRFGGFLVGCHDDWRNHVRWNMCPSSTCVDNNKHRRNQLKGSFWGKGTLNPELVRWEPRHLWNPQKKQTAWQKSISWLKIKGPLGSIEWWRYF